MQAHPNQTGNSEQEIRIQTGRRASIYRGTFCTQEHSLIEDPGRIVAGIVASALGKKDLHGPRPAYGDRGSAQMAELADAVDSKSTAL
jgi:hypothetical protein